jgi:hypothetical protein
VETRDRTIAFWMFCHQEINGTGHQNLLKSLHTGRYLNFKSNNPPHVKRGSIHNTPSSICQEWQDLVNEVSSLRYNFQLNGCPEGFTDSDIYTKCNSHLGSLCVSHIRSSTVIPKVSLTQTFIPSVAVIWALCVYPIYEGCFREVQTHRDSIHQEVLQN